MAEHIPVWQDHPTGTCAAAWFLGYNCEIGQRGDNGLFEAEVNEGVKNLPLMRKGFPTMEEAKVAVDETLERMVLHCSSNRFKLSKV